MEPKRNDLLLVAVLLGAGFLMLFAFILVILVAFVGMETTFAEEDGIGVLEISGVIEDSQDLLDDLHEFVMDDSVRAILVRIDSPGGAVAPSQEIYKELLGLRGKKRVVVSMGSLAASGGYYIACAGERLFANPGTITGSIGVIIESAYLMELMNFLKIEPIVYKSGEHKDILSPFRRPTPQDDTLIKGMITDVYDQFLTAVAAARNLDKEALRPIADGRILSGQQALTAGLVDELGGFRDAVRYIAAQEGLGDDPVLIYPEEESLAYLEKFFETASLSFVHAIDKARRPAVQYRLAE